MTRDIAIDIQDYQNRSFFINGVISEFRRRGETRFKTLTVVAEYGVNAIELQMALIGQIVSRRFQESSFLSYVGSVSEIRRETEELLQMISHEVIFHMDSTIGDAFKQRFEYALNFLYPMVVTDGDDVMFCHPFILSSLSQFNLFSRIIVERTDPRLFNALKLLDKIPTATVQQLQNSTEAKFFRSKGIFEDLVIRVLSSSIKGIRLSRMLKQCF